MSKKKKRRLFYWLYGALTLCLLLGCGAALLSVRSLLRQYEACQPEKAVAAEAAALCEKAAAGTLWDYLPRPAETRSRFDGDAPGLWDTYEKKLAAGGLTAARQSGAFSEDGLTFVLLQDGEPVATVALRARHTETRLLVFTFSDWRVESVTPLATAYSYSYRFRLPAGFTAALNGLPLAETEKTGEADGTLLYEVTDLAREPVITVLDSFGTEAAYNIEDGVLTPVTYTCDADLPAGLSVCVGEVRLAPVSEEGGVSHYHLVTARKPALLITDSYGGSVPYTEDTVITGGTRCVTVPAPYSVRVGDTVLDPAAAAASVNPDYPADLPYAEDLPAQLTYTFVILDTTPVVLLDPAGRETLLEHPDGTVLRELPDSPGEPEIDVLTVARSWSLFMTNDLVGSTNGYYRMAAYLLPDSYLADKAWRWANGIDVTFTSVHTLGNPPFRNESVTYYVSYSDRLFSVDVHLEKPMHLNSGLNVTDVMNSRLWFALTENGYKLCAMQERLAEGGNS